MRRGLLLATAWLMLMLTTTTTATGQNLVVNGDFDVGMDNWAVGGLSGGTGDPSAVIFRGDVDALGDFSSGSVQLDSPSESTLISQCVPISLPLTSFTHGTAIQGDESALFRLDFYADSSCSTPPTFGGGLTSVQSADFRFRISTWPLATHVPPDTQSIQVTFGRGGPIGPPLLNLFDKVFLVRGLPEDFPPHKVVAEVDQIEGLTATLSSLASGGISPFPRRYLWSLGDGSFAEGQQIVHTFAAPETYLISLEADSGYDESVFDQIEVTVTGTASEIPTASSIGLAVLIAILGVGGMILLRSRVTT